MKTRILMITYNRPAYTAMSLERLCATLPKDARVTVWDNGSGPELLDVLKKYESHPAVEKIIFNKTNDKLRGPTNSFWENSADAEFVGKVDDDCLMPDGWIEYLEKAHRDVPQFGILGTWLFPEEDFVESLASKKLTTFGSHTIFRNCWVGGSGYLMKREVIQRIGNIRGDESFSDYCIRAAAAGFINGLPYPFLYQEHMDDPRAPHTGIKTEADFQRIIPLSASTFGVRDINEWTAKLKQLALSLQTCSYDPNDYLGLKARVLKKICRLFGVSYMPKA